MKTKVRLCCFACFSLVLICAITTVQSQSTTDCTYDSWTATSTTNAPIRGGAAVWTGTEMIVWDHISDSGGRYNPETDSWNAISTTNAPSEGETAIWTGSEMIVWGGNAAMQGFPGSGARYSPASDTWSATSTTNAPTGRTFHTAVWTGNEMIVWGGYRRDSNGLLVETNTGGRYNPSTDSWVATSFGPNRRHSHTAVWTGSEMIVWGGIESQFGVSDGWKYNPNTDSWVEINSNSGPPGAGDHAAVWTGSEMIVWGGLWFVGTRDTGGRYNPATDSWVLTSTSNAPTSRFGHTGVWTGREMIVWGGNDSSPDTGARYNPNTNSWVATTLANAPTGRRGHTAVWTGSEMIVWGGSNLNTGGRYCAQLPTTGGSGSFVIGDLDAVVGNRVYFWGSDWARQNHLSQGSAPSAFKGFANSIGATIPNCGDVWQSNPRNSSDPPSALPSIITVLASGSIGRSGSIVSGNNRKIVVVRPDPGYGPNPGHAGTGIVVSIACE